MRRSDKGRQQIQKHGTERGMRKKRKERIRPSTLPSTHNQQQAARQQQARAVCCVLHAERCRLCVQKQKRRARAEAESRSRGLFEGVLLVDVHRIVELFPNDDKK